MVRSLFLLAVLPAVALAQAVVVSPTITYPDNMEDFPTIINDYTSTTDLITTYPPGTMSLDPQPPTYPTETETATYPSETAPPPSYGTGAPPPPPSTSGTSDQEPQPTATETATEIETETYGIPPPPVETTTMETSVYEPPAVTASQNATGTEGLVAPTETFNSGGNTFSVKLPVVLGALGLVFAML
jgi:hypothetical protein